MSDKGSNGSNRGSLNLENWSIHSSPPSNNNVFVNARYANENNDFAGNVAEGNIAFKNAEVQPVLNAQVLGRNNQMAAFARARRLRSQRVTNRPLHNHYVTAQHHNAMAQGTIRMIDKNGASVLVGETDPRFTTRSTESMRREYEQIISDPAATLPDVQRAHQLLRMVHTREAREYLERERIRRERTLAHRLQRGTQRLQLGTQRLQIGTQRFRNGIRGLFSRVNAGGRARTRSRERSRTPGGTRRAIIRPRSR